MDTVYFARWNDVVALRFVGCIRYPLSPALEHFINGLLAQNDPPIHAIVIDLCQTQLIDSTNLGLLARLANWSLVHLQAKPVLYSTNPDVTNVLLAVSFDLVFTMVECLPMDHLGDAPLSLPSGTEPAALADTVLRAHETLMALSVNNHQQFADVVRLLRKEPE